MTASRRITSGCFLQLWIAASLSSDSKPHCDWPVVDGRFLTQSSFERKYLEKKPIVVENLIGEWPAITQQLWTEAKILERYGEFKFDSSHVANACREISDFRDGTELRELLNSSGPASWFVMGHHPMVRDMLARKDWEIPDGLKPMSQSPFISISGKGKGNIFHSHKHNWLAQIHGTKRWFVRPPDAPELPSDALSARNDEPCGPRPDWSFLSGCEVKAGQVVYLPSSYQHETCSTGDFNIGVGYLGHKYGAGSLWLKSSPTALSVMLGQLPKLDVPVPRADLMEQDLLHIAAHSGHVDVATWLIENRADVQRRVGGPDSRGEQPIHLAAQRGHFPMVELLNRYGSSFSDTMKNGASVLSLAAEFGHKPILQHVLARAEKSFIKDGIQIQESLRLAGTQGHVACARLLLKHLSAVDAKVLGNSVFVEAIESSWPRVARGVMRSVGLSLDSVNAHLVEHSPDQLPIVHLAASKGHVRCLRFLADLNANLDIVDKSIFAGQWMKPIQLAGAHGHLPVVQYLASARADLAATDFAGNQLVHMSALQGHSLVVKFLAGQGLDLQSTVPAQEANSQFAGKTPLHFAAIYGHADVIKELLDHGVSRDALDSNKKLPIDLAKEGGASKKVIRLLRHAMQEL